MVASQGNPARLNQKVNIMDNFTAVLSVEDSSAVLGSVCEKAIEDYSSATKAQQKKRGVMQSALFERGIPSRFLASPGKDKAKQEETCELSNGGIVTWLQVFDATKLAIAAGRGKAELELYTASPAELSDDRKKQRNDLVRVVGSIVGKVKESLEKKEEQENLNMLQAREDAAAKDEGREPELITKASLTPTRSDEVRIGECLIKIIKICQASTEPDYDVTAMVAYARTMLVEVNQTDTTKEA